MLGAQAPDAVDCLGFQRVTGCRAGTFRQPAESSVVEYAFSQAIWTGVQEIRSFTVTLLGKACVEGSSVQGREGGIIASEN